MPRIGRSVIIAGATALILAAGSGIATAAVMSSSSPVDSSGVIHGCWTNAEINGTHAFVLQDAGTTCPRGTTAISWNESGPKGPAGAAGTVSSLDQLNGIPCDSGAGTTELSYGSGGAVGITCVTPTPTAT